MNTTLLKLAMAQAVAGAVVEPSLLEQKGELELDEANGWKITLLAWVMRHGPFAVFSMVLTTAIVFLSSVLAESYKEDRALSQAMGQSNMLMAKSVAKLVEITEEGNTTSEKIYFELHDFTLKMEQMHPEQNRMLRDLWQKGMQ